MLKILKPLLLGCLALAIATPALAQVKQTREQMMFYTSQWKGERFPDGRPRVPDDLLKRVVNVSVEDLWDYLRDKGFNCQFDTGYQMLHPEKPFAGRALTAQYMPLRRDMYDAIAAEGKREGRVSGNNSWPIAELKEGDMYVADGFGKIVEGTLIGSNLGSGIATHSKTGFVFDAGIRDAEENRELENMNGLYRAYDPVRLEGHDPDHHQRAHPHRPRHGAAGRSGAGQEGRRDLHPGLSGGGRGGPCRVHQPGRRLQFRPEPPGQEWRRVRGRLECAQVRGLCATGSTPIRASCT